MHIKELKKVGPLLQRIEVLDKDIVQIERYANKIKDIHVVIQLELSHKNTEKEKSVQFDDDGSIVSARSFFHSMYMPGLIELGNGSRKEENKDCCKMEISEVIALQCLGVMVAYKEAERMAIINQLNSLGFEINI